MATPIVKWQETGRGRGLEARKSISYKLPTFQAIQIDDDMSQAAVLVLLEYENQNFAFHATAWERYYGQPLLAKNGKPFVPIVNKSGLVVGYCGRAAGGHVWSKGAVPPDMSWDQFGDLGITAYYAKLNHNEAKAKKENGWTSLHSQTVYTIICSIDGQVLDMAGAIAAGEIKSEGLGGLEILVDVLSGAYLVKGIGKAVLKRILVVGSTGGMKSLVRRIGAAVGKSLKRRLPGDKLAGELRQKVGKVGVNLGGTDEVRNYINVNNLIGGQKAEAIPNLLNANAEDVALLFSAETVDHVVANNIVAGTFNWDVVAKGSYTVLRKGGKVGFAEFGGGALRGQNIKAALDAAGFSEIEILAGTLVTAVKR